MFLNLLSPLYPVKQEKGHKSFKNDLFFYLAMGNYDKFTEYAKKIDYAKANELNENGNHVLHEAVLSASPRFSRYICNDKKFNIFIENKNNEIALDIANKYHNRVFFNIISEAMDKRIKSMIDNIS